MTVCTWPVDYGPGCTRTVDLEPDVLATIEETAVDLLWNFSGRKFGVCPVVIRPCAVILPTGNRDFMTPKVGGGGMALQPVLIDGQWQNLTCSGYCTTTGPSALRLPGPVVSITEVKIDGAVVPAGQYRLDYRNVLIRNGGLTWPVTQQLLADADSDVNTFQISYERGVPVPIGGQLAAGRLACEMAKAYVLDASCKLPQRVQTVTRQGVTVGFTDAFDGLDKGRTGLWEIDSWLASVTNVVPRSAVRSVDVRTSAY